MTDENINLFSMLDVEECGSMSHNSFLLSSKATVLKVLTNIVTFKSTFLLTTKTGLRIKLEDCRIALKVSSDMFPGTFKITCQGDEIILMYLEKLDNPK